MSKVEGSSAEGAQENSAGVNQANAGEYMSFEIALRAKVEGLMSKVKGLEPQWFLTLDL